MQTSLEMMGIERDYPAFKRCSRCKERKETKEFGTRRWTLKNGRDYWVVKSQCRECVAKKNKEIFQRHEQDNGRTYLLGAGINGEVLS